MKTYCFFFLVWIFVINSSLAKIRNGYTSGIYTARQSLKVLNDLLLKNESRMTSAQKKKLNASVNEALEYIVYYEVTEILLAQFKTVAPELYREIDSLYDKKGRMTDVYIRFIPEHKARVQAWGVTGINQVAGDSDASCSEYGPLTVSVTIWLVKKSLLVLSHELGHIKYMVPNMARYVKYYRQNYRNGLSDSHCIGHHTNDAGGKSASTFEKRFRKNYFQYFKANPHLVQSPPVLAREIRKNLVAGIEQRFGIVLRVL